MIRDNALSVSGLISLKQFGPPIRPYQPDEFQSNVGRPITLVRDERQFEDCPT